LRVTPSKLTGAEECPEAATLTWGRASRSPRFRSAFLHRSARSAADTVGQSWPNNRTYYGPDNHGFLISHPDDHNLGCLDQSGCRLTSLRFISPGRSRGEDRGNLLLADRNRNFCQKPANTDRLNAPHQSVPSTHKPPDQTSFSYRFSNCSKQQPINFTARNAVMSPDAANLPLVNPLLYCRKTDSKLQSRVT